MKKYEVNIVELQMNIHDAEIEKKEAKNPLALCRAEIKLIQLKRELEAIPEIKKDIILTKQYVAD